MTRDVRISLVYTMNASQEYVNEDLNKRYMNEATCRQFIRQWYTMVIVSLHSTVVLIHLPNLPH